MNDNAHGEILLGWGKRMKGGDEERGRFCFDKGTAIFL
jgi:hypothetical protein